MSRCVSPWNKFVSFFFIGEQFDRRPLVTAGVPTTWPLVICHCRGANNLTPGHLSQQRCPTLPLVISHRRSANNLTAGRLSPQGCKQLDRWPLVTAGVQTTWPLAISHGRDANNEANLKHTFYWTHDNAVCRPTQRNVNATKDMVNKYIL